MLPDHTEEQRAAAQRLALVQKHGPDGPTLDGRTHFKRRLLARLGWTCAAVPYFEWDPLLASGATEPYLRGVLARLKSE